MNRENCRAASRLSAYPDGGNSSTGFRIVRAVP